MVQKKEPSCVKWFENLLASLARVESPRSSGWHENATYHLRWLNSTSQKEIAIEIYHALHQSDISLRDLSQHIGEIGNLLNQVDLRQLATQPKSRQRQMFSLFFDYHDISQAVPECLRQDSYAYVYLLVRLLYEILLYTKSNAVRSFCFYQMMRNAEVLKVLFGLVTKEVRVKGVKGTEFSEDVTIETMNTVGLPPQHFHFNVMDNILKQMLTSPDLNLRICGLELLRLSPYIVAGNPKILSELKDALLGPMEECASKAAISLYTILEYVEEDIAIRFLQTSHDHVVGVEYNPQRIKSFCCIALGCRERECCKLAYRMCWNIWLHIDHLRGTGEEADVLIVRESQFYLMITSTLISAQQAELNKRQKMRLEALLYDQKEQERDMEVAFCLNILCKKNGEMKDVIKLIKTDVKEISLTTDLTRSIFQIHLQQYKQNENLTSFQNAITAFESLVTADHVNLELICELKSAFKYLKANTTDCMMRILKVVVPQYEMLNGEYEYLRSVVLRSIANITKMCYITELQKFNRMIPEIKEIVGQSEIKFVIKPTLSINDFDVVDNNLTSTKVNLWVHTLYDLSNFKPPKIHNYIAYPVRVDMLTAKLVPDPPTSAVKVMVITKKDNFNTGILKDHMSKLIFAGLDNITSGAAIRQVVHLSLRLGLYSEAASCLKRLELYTTDTLLWFNGLYHYAMAELETDLYKSIRYRVQGLDALETYSHQCTMWALNKTANDVMAPRLNYALPELVTYTWCVLRLCFQVAVGHLYQMTQDNLEDCATIAPIFQGLFGHFKVLKWSFRGTCSEVDEITQIYEGLCILLYAICNVTEPQTDGHITEPDEELRRYILSLFAEGDTHWPQTFAIIDLLDPAIKKQLYTAPALLAARKTLVGGTTKTRASSGSSTTQQLENEPMPESLGELSLESILQEFVLFSRLRTNKDKYSARKLNTGTKGESETSTQNEVYVSYFSRDIDQLCALVHNAKLCDSQQRTATSIQELVQNIGLLKLPMPEGVIKTFPLPFASLTAIVDYEKRADEGPVAVHIQGSMRNCARRITFVKIKMEVVDEQNNTAVIFRRKFRMKHNAIDKYVHSYLQLQQIDRLRFSCLPLDSEEYPCGVPTYFRPTLREMMT
ncbi:hypothetical protein BaOVIS_022590 [Babesia ovis]|uniref:Uncharacterized protein n=1 Tax=Babesia ovis TaxID=5869 RepID=A0A9W5WVA8_BABOV|nr:hypothetical protein BaOVIS_022590 [Babesia ovis]